MHLAKTATIIVLCCSVISCAFLSGVSVPETPESVDEFPGLVKVRTIYISDLGNEEGSGVVREKIRLRLSKSIRFSVVEVPQNADAILTGVAGVERRYDGSGGELQTHYAGIGILRLVDVRTSETIWTFEYKRGFGFYASASSRVADQAIDKLLEDTSYIDNKKSNGRPR